MSDKEPLSDQEEARRAEELVDAELTGADDAFTRVELKEAVDPESGEAETTRAVVRDDDRHGVEVGEEEDFGGGGDE